MLHRQLLNIGLVKPISFADYLAGQGSAFLLHRTEALAASERITEHDVDPPYELLLQHNASIFGRHAAGKTILVLREVLACSSQALSGLCPRSMNKHSDFCAI